MNMPTDEEQDELAKYDRRRGDGPDTNKVRTIASEEAAKTLDSAMSGVKDLLTAASEHVDILEEVRRRLGIKKNMGLMKKKV